MTSKQHTARLLVVLGLLLLAACRHAPAPPAAPQLPNMLVVLTDDQGWGDAAWHGNTVLETPHLNRLASQGIDMTRFYVSPVCAPTRASLLTGRYHLATGVTWVTHRKEVMRTEEQTLPELLQPKGYTSGLFGKWHNGKQHPYHPNSQGFDTFIGFTDGHWGNYFNQTLQHNGQPMPTKGYLPDAITTHALKFMAHTQGPWLCLVTYNTPHSPFQVPDAYFHKYKNKGLGNRLAAIYGMVENIDYNMGRLLHYLDSTGQAQNTVVVFLSDNGPNGHRYNGGYKGIKAAVDEGGVRVPCIIRYPAKGWAGGRKDTAMAAHIDLAPTLAGLAGIAPPKNRPWHGRNLAPRLNMQASSNNRAFFTHQVIRKFDSIPGAVRTNRYLLTLQNHDTALFDVYTDPYQKNNIKQVLPAMADSLALAYRHWFKTMTAQGIAPPPIIVGHPAQPAQQPVTLPAEEVAHRTAVAFAGQEGWAGDYLVRWQPQGSVSWAIDVLQPGAYQMLAQLSTGPAAGGYLTCATGAETISTQVTQPYPKRQLPAPDRVPRGEMHDYAWPKVVLGTLPLQAGQQTVTLTASGVNDLSVKSIQLIKQ